MSKMESKTTKIKVVCVSGNGGGNAGPNGCYARLHKYFYGDIIRFDTIEDDLDQNIASLMVLLKGLDKLDEVILVGWSRGGAVIINTAYKLQNEIKIVGLILLASQTYKTKMIKNLKIPIIMAHGDVDDVLDIKNMWLLRKRCKSSTKCKTIICVNATHNFYDVNTNSRLLATMIAGIDEL